MRRIDHGEGMRKLKTEMIGDSCALKSIIIDGPMRGAI